MDAFTMTTPADTVPNDRDDLIIQITNLREQVDRLQRNWEYANNSNAELRQKIDNVKGLIRDLYSENGEILDYVEEIASLLDIELTKEISGTATYTISFTANVPLDFDADDFEISFDVNCDTDDAEGFDWNEDNCEINFQEA